ncbi:stimulator of interferon genes protein-like [Haliotis rufescens]|uniref:stimulator of interferon genes protein-like n=1 Tax=Haliotis rufescens TaxID=6454 RepID=UPI00201F6DF2|nr:stimulator of interferon genes protein-like [Haliotis rufescens]
MATSRDLDTLIQLEEDEEYDFELAQRRMEAERAAREVEAFQRNTLNLDIPPLPNGKSHHLFISHSNDPPEEAEWAEQLVNTMERDFGLKCLWPKRDFTPGHDVGSLIQNGIVSSVKVVFILSPASMESRWCEYERNFAFGISVENRENQIIPVMLCQCDFPGILKTLNYIDVPAGEDYAFKIRRCFDEDTRDFEHLVPEMMKYWKNEKGEGIVQALYVSKQTQMARLINIPGVGIHTVV